MQSTSSENNSSEIDSVMRPRLNITEFPRVIHIIEWLGN